MKTPLQEAIQTIKEHRDFETSPVVISRLDTILFYLASLLEKEKEHIMDAYEVSHISMMTAEQYYKEKYGGKAII